MTSIDPGVHTSTSDWQLTTPIVLIVFNRPDLTRRIFAEIARARPQTLLIIADGARLNREGEDSRVREVRSIVEVIDWPCDVRRCYSETNLGCGRRVSSGLDWVFDQVDRAIILEDDCIPTRAFFRYCSALLDKYNDNYRVFSISGSNFSRRQSAVPGHYFSNYPLMWGWATWRTRWALHEACPQSYLRILIRMWGRRPLTLAYWLRIFRSVVTGQIDTWDFQWMLTVWRNKALTCRPSTNLIQNIGFGSDATHTKRENLDLSLPAIDNLDDFSTPLGPPVPDFARDKIDEQSWALINIRTVLLLYFPWLGRIRRRGA